MKSLKLKKVKISRVTNLHLILGGVNGAAGQTTQEPQHPETYTLDTKYDDSCIPGTNGATLRTIGAPIDNNVTSNLNNSGD
ncbi:hypothetical protein C8N46_107159 [Kordia periserrulae]|uniref:Uncharacterized protein n=1 Tax=Kordia periserrulae TaxID=701523 RepID=A0A2T6BVR6_9FLAO|nr:hypothetical protein [Kordia periserrulae]PTX60153.1 hypothetical protein C8N46_107159 [Kordia periserrulae]